MLSLGKLSQEDLLNIHSVLLLIARSGIEGCSYSSISKNVGITKYMARQYIGMMDSASLLKVVMPYGANVIQELKILLNPGIRPTDIRISSFPISTREIELFLVPILRDRSSRVIPATRRASFGDYFTSPGE